MIKFYHARRNEYVSTVSRLLTDMQVGNADPFSRFFPLKILSHSLQRFQTWLSQKGLIRYKIHEAYVVTSLSPRVHRSTILAPSFASAITAAIASAIKIRYCPFICTKLNKYQSLTVSDFRRRLILGDYITLHIIWCDYELKIGPGRTR